MVSLSAHARPRFFEQVAIAGVGDSNKERALRLMPDSIFFIESAILKLELAKAGLIPIIFASRASAIMRETEPVPQPHPHARSQRHQICQHTRNLLRLPGPRCLLFDK